MIEFAFGLTLGVLLTMTLSAMGVITYNHEEK